MKTFALLFTLTLSAIPHPLNAANSVVQTWIKTLPGLDRTANLSVPAPTSFAGTWKTERRCKPYTVILTQHGHQVNGTYSPGNGKIFSGIVTDNKLSFRWTEDGAEGFGEFMMTWDSKNFTGTSSAVKPNGMVVTWSTSTPAVAPFAGVWQTRADGKNDISLTMLQSGDQVMGTYQGNGKLEGTVSGKVLRFKWRSSGGTGSGRFVMEAKNNSFNGTYNRGSNPDDVESTWSGQLPPGPEGRPGPCDPQGVVYGYPRDAPSERDERARNGTVSEAELAKKQAEFEERQKNAPATFAGVWLTKSGEKIQFPELIFQQADNKVVGRLFANRPDFGVIKEGIVNRNTLRFQVWGPDPARPFRLDLPGRYMGTGELVMNADGKSFKGTILGTATSGTLIAR